MDASDYGRIAAIKCDVEGLELRVLRGALRTLKREGPALLVEVEEQWAARYGTKAHDVFELLAGLGYRSQLVAGSNVLFVRDLYGPYHDLR